MSWIGFKRMRDVAAIIVLAAAAAACIRQGVSADRNATKRLYVQGFAAHVSDRELARIARPYLMQPFFEIDTAALTRRLNGLPWLHNVTVTRRWPNGVLIRLHEYRPVARWNDAALLAANGDLFRPQEEIALSQLPVLTGPRGHANAVYDLYQRLAAIVGNGGWGLAGLEQNDNGAWRATLANGLQLRLGEHDVVVRVHRFTRFADASIRVRKSIAHGAYVDLRYADGFAVGGSRSAVAPNTTKEQIG